MACGRKGKRRKMKKFRMDEISAVDNPAQSGAKMVLMKRADGAVDEGSNPFTKSHDGHKHAIDVCADGDGKMSVLVGFSGDPENPHQHEITFTEDGSLVVSKCNDHTHEIDGSVVNAILFDCLMKKRDPEEIKADFYQKRTFTAEQRRNMASSGQAMSDGSFPIANRGDLMNAIQAFGRSKDKSATAKHIRSRAKSLGLTDLLPSEGELANLMKKREDSRMSTETEAKLADMQKKLDANDKALKKANALASMNDAEKAYYKSLNDKDQEEFINKSSEERAAAMKAAKEDNPVVYKSLDGTEFTKSDDPRLVAMAKRGDEQEKELAKARSINADNELRKRAETEFQYLPGDVDVRMQLIKSADSIPDEGVRKKALEALKAQNTEMSKAFANHGSSATLQKDGDQVDAEAELDRLTKARMADKNEDYYTAYDVVKNSNRELYTKAVGH